MGRKWSDTDMELYLSRLMRYGIILATVIVVIGAVLFLLSSGTTKPNYSIFTGEPKEFTSVFGIINAISEGSGKGFIELGLLVLISIPILRVAFSVISFIIERDKVYILITSLVLALLLFSLLGSK